MIITFIFLAILMVVSFVVEWKTFEHALRGKYITLNAIAAWTCSVSGILLIVAGIVAINTMMG